MKIKTLKLENYRNHNSLTLDLTKNKIYLVGKNAKGKTNILESIYILALTKSFRTSTSENLINWDKDYSRITGTFNNDLQLELFLGKYPNPKKNLKKNGVKTSVVDFIGSFQVVFFHPEDLNILYLGPELRRKYLDIF